jgi:uncharacterized integral membrane protein
MEGKLVLIIVLIALALIIMFQNKDVVGFQILFWSIGISKILMILMILIVGFAIGFVTARMKRGGG